MTVNFNDAQTEENHQGARDFVFWNLPQVSILLKLVYLFIIDLSCFLSWSQFFYPHCRILHTIQIFRPSTQYPFHHLLYIVLYNRAVDIKDLKFYTFLSK